MVSVQLTMNLWDFLCKNKNFLAQLQKYHWWYYQWYFCKKWKIFSVFGSV